MFTKILIANRGEIACRVIATAKKMGIATVAVYSEADKDALHVRLADEAVCIGPAASKDSYLRGDTIIAAAKSTGAQAIHPGYGFLSENEAFAAAVADAGLAFIGPSAASIAAMGDKIASKKLAQAAGVSTIPGHNEPILSADEAVQVATRIGYPVMLKASAGGGGKGLRVVFNDAQAAAGFVSCQNEARVSFGDDRVFAEKFIEEPRHIEIQILGDQHGNVIYLNERECSIQRRHQKVIEEAPSPFITDATRRAMGAQAVELAKAVQYHSAGTVEFVVGKDQSFYFLEMNTRLQVEHPVTELITGLDLVEQMIRVAAGQTLPIAQEQVQKNGWAMECRINAEDPFRGFLPSTGRLVRFSPPQANLQAGVAGDFGVRVDTGVTEGGQISMHYDSMIAKLIVHGRDRAHAIALMKDALNGFVIRGVSSNTPFQSALLLHPDFVSGQFNTGFIGSHFKDGLTQDKARAQHPDAMFMTALAAFVRRKSRQRTAKISGQLNGFGVEVGNAYCVIGLDPKGTDHTYTDIIIDENSSNPHSARIICQSCDATGAGANSATKAQEYVINCQSRISEVRLTGTCNGEPFVAQVERGTRANPLALRLSHHGVRLDAMVVSARMGQLYRLMPHKVPPDLSKYLIAPMPGLLTKIAVQVGQSVIAGETLAIIEAMKMENTLTAMQNGTVKAIRASQGSSVAVDEVLIEFE